MGSAMCGKALAFFYCQQGLLSRAVKPRCSTNERNQLMNSPRLNWLTYICVSAALVGLLLIGSTAVANAPINPGFDLLSTPPFPLLLGPTGPTAIMTGDPIGPGNTDTIVQRFTPGPPPGQSATIPIELVALSLQSVQPVLIDLGMGPQPYDLHIGLQSGNPSQGQMTINHDGLLGGGTFDSEFVVNSLLTFSPTGGGADVIVPRSDPLSSTGSPWSHIQPPNYPDNAMLPSGGFYPGVLPGTAIPVGVDHMGPHPHTDPAMPEPASFVLAAIALAGVTGAFRKARV
jgi:hypothetical protein